jgi:hypothetical protein
MKTIGMSKMKKNLEISIPKNSKLCLHLEDSFPPARKKRKIEKRVLHQIKVLKENKRMVGGL